MSKVAIVTGGASGIGLATASLFAENGYQVIQVDNRVLGSRFPQVLRCDVSQPDRVQALFQSCKDTFGRLDLLVNCAGVHYSSRVHEDDIERFDWLTRTNIYGTYYCCREALKLMEEGVIINVASSVGIAADPAAAAYSASKAWVIHFTKCIAQEYGRKVRCNSICPGPTDTPLWRNAFGNDPVKMEEVKKVNPMGKIATPDEIAKVILFVASDEASFVNGATWEVDGGESIFYYEPPKG